MFDSTSQAGRTRFRRVLSLLAIPLLLLAAACTSRGVVRRPALKQVSVETSSKSTRAYVINKSFEDLRIYFMRNGSRTPLGWVQGYGSTILTIPEAVIGFGDGVQLVAGQPGSSAARCVTQVLTIMPGSRIHWVILEKHLMTSASVDW